MCNWIEYNYGNQSWQHSFVPCSTRRYQCLLVAVATLHGIDLTSLFVSIFDIDLNETHGKINFKQFAMIIVLLKSGSAQHQKSLLLRLILAQRDSEHFPSWDASIGLWKNCHSLFLQTLVQSMTKTLSSNANWSAKMLIKHCVFIWVADMQKNAQLHFFPCSCYHRAFICSLCTLKAHLIRSRFSVGLLHSCRWISKWCLCITLTPHICAADFIHFIAPNG